MRTLAFASTIALLGLTSTAEAHFTLVAPLPSNPLDTPAHPNDDQPGKGPPPCGPDATPAAVPFAVQGGHTLHIDVKETTYHPGHYRFALSTARSGLPADPNVYDKNMTLLDPTKGNTTSATATIEMPAVFPVLADDVWDHTTPPTKDWTMDLPIPNMDCADCVLELEQFMAQHPSNVGIGGFFYHHCADLKITADPSMPLAGGGTPDAGAGDAGHDASTTGTGGSTGSAGAAGGSPGGTAGQDGTAGATSTGTAGATTTGTAGTGSAGATGSAGSTTSTGTAGSTGGKTGSSSGGCSLSNSSSGRSAALYVPALAFLALLTRRLRSRRRR
jgi:hypothetical protein